MGQERDEALAALRWLTEAGADEAIEAEPIDRLRASAPEQDKGGSAEPAAKPAEEPPPEQGLFQTEAPAPPKQEVSEASGSWQPEPSAPASAEAAVASARQLAAAADSVTALKAALEAFEGCPLKATATNLCFADGNPDAHLMIIGEAPGAEEDRQGLPFVGSSGRFMDRMLSYIGLDRTKVYISNVLYWRPPGNRTPTAQEIATCLPFVERMIELVDPSILLLAGGISAKTLLGRSEGILRLRGHWRYYQHAGLPRPIPALPTLHPAYLLRQPAQKRLAWQDYLKFSQAVRSGEDPLAHNTKGP